MKIYISGPMSGVEDLNFPAFHAAAERLRAVGYEVISPAEITVDQDASWEQCLRADIKQLVDCDAVATLPWWQSSRGALLEIDIAMRLSMPVRAVDDWHHEASNHP